MQAIASTSDMIDPARRTEDSGLVLLKFANGCVGEVTVSYVLKHPHLGASWDVMPIEIYGRDGSIRMDEHDTITVASDKISGDHRTRRLPGPDAARRRRGASTGGGDGRCN